MEITLAHISASLHLCSFIHVISLLVFPFSYSLIYTSRPPLSWLLKIKDNYDYQQTEAAAAAKPATAATPQADDEIDRT